MTGLNATSGHATGPLIPSAACPQGFMPSQPSVAVSGRTRQPPAEAGEAAPAAGMRRTGRVEVSTPYLGLPGMGDVEGAAPVVPDGMIMSATRLSFGSISKTWLLSSLAYSRPFAAGTP